MAETEIKSINGRTLADVTARARIEEIKNAAPGLVFDTVADMEAYIAGNAGTLKVGQDLFIRDADVPDYWWDGTAAVPVETELGEVRKELGELSSAVAAVGNEVYVLMPGETLDDVPDGVKVVYELPEEGTEEDGEDGESNESGGAVIPYIGENGNWFVGGTDTGVKAQGDKGEPGDDYILTEADKTEIARQAAELVDTALLSIIGEVE